MSKKIKSKSPSDRNRNWVIKKLALPDVRVGSIIEVRFILRSPFIFNWRSWEFQSDIPKLNSEFRAKIPANYNYNIVLRGPFKLTKNQTDVIRDCLSVGTAKADCSLLMYAMSNIPAFKEERYMTSKDNFLSALNFELIDIKRFDGTIAKYTEEWKDVDKRLAKDENFGDQVKQSKKLWSDRVQAIIINQVDPLKKAKIIFDEIKNYYSWNEDFGSFAELGAKKAFQQKKGNVADINLSLAGALQAGGFQADPVMISTRKNGLPVMLHPVISGFNYVIVRIIIGEDCYWLDATHRLHPFGFVPERCLNGKVRVMSKVSEWVELKPKDKDKKVSELNLTVTNEGDLEGTLNISHFGYDAFDQRNRYISFSSPEEYVKSISKNWNDLEILSYSFQAVDSIDKPFVEKFKLVFTEKANSDLLYISPFLIERWNTNPFRSTDRKYPVDFGAPLEEITMLKIDYKNLYAVDELPKSSVSTLPLSGGRFSFNVTNLNNAIQMTSNLSLNKSVYSSEEYHYLRELIARVIQVQQTQFVLRKNK